MKSQRQHYLAIKKEIAGDSQLASAQQCALLSACPRYAQCTLALFFVKPRHFIARYWRAWSYQLTQSFWIANGAFMSLSHDDVVRIIQILNASHFDELSLEAEGVKLNIRRNGAGETGAQVHATPIAVSVPAAEKPAPQVAAPVVVKPSAGGEAGLIDIRAPMLGCVLWRA
jgi:hypothetical protein